MSLLKLFAAASGGGAPPAAPAAAAAAAGTHPVAAAALGAAAAAAHRGPPGGGGPLMAVPSGSVAAAACVAAAFLLLALPVAYSLKRTRFKTYILLLASLLFRGAAYALHAAAIAQCDPNQEAGYHALRAAGFGMAIGVLGLMLVSWFKNSAGWARPFGARVALNASRLARACIPVVILAGPVLGAVAAGLMYSVSQTPTKISATMAVREASSYLLCAMLGAITLLAALGLASVLLGASRGPVSGGAPTGAPPSVWGDIHAWVALPLAAALLLIPPTAQRIGALHDPRRYMLDQRYVYALAALPEVLNAAVLAAPGLLARVAMNYNWEDHLAAAGLLEGGGGAANANGGGGGGKGVVEV